MRWDETWHRLREWTNSAGQSERLAAQILLHEGFTGLDPSHPLGGPDGGRDAVCQKQGSRWILAVYFPRGQKDFSEIQRKFSEDLLGLDRHGATGLAFVTNQELRLAERSNLRKSAQPRAVELLHLERVAAILDSPTMGSVREQFLGIRQEPETIIALGGQGGNQPGAGGGGGAAIGPNATGGPGGPGGNIITLQGTPGRAPGAGGGGGGAIGAEAQGGEGGGGGERVDVEVSLTPLEAMGFDHCEIRVGQGGRDGGPGEDTIVNFVTADGKVLKSILAHAGAPGTPSQPVGSRTFGRDATQADVDEGGLQVSSVLLADCVHIRNGLLYLLSAGWEYYCVSTVPFRMEWPLACTVSLGTLTPDTVLRLSAIVRDPSGFQVLEEPFSVSASSLNTVVKLEFTGSLEGTWPIEIVSGDVRLARLPIKVQQILPDHGREVCERTTT